jgi:hypothetical protein
MVVSMLAPLGGIEAALATLAQRMGAAAAERYRCGDFDPASIARQHIEVYRFARGVSKARAIDLAA